MAQASSSLDALSAQSRVERIFAGCLLGTAVGDAVGLAGEGLSPRRWKRMFDDLDGPQLLGRRGMISDDTEHTLFTARALALCGDDPSRFALLLQRELKTWLLGLPAGAGAATLKAAARAWRGASPERCGVYSAGNGPVMRAPIIGLWAGEDENLLCALNRASSRLTHSDPRAEAGALAVALAARELAFDGSGDDFVPRSCAHIVQGLRAGMVGGREESEAAREMASLVERAGSAVGASTEEFAREVVGEKYDKVGVSGFVLHTVPVALHAAWQHRADVREAVLSVVHCAGDADSTGAIVGALVGARLGSPAIPRDWLRALWEWPRGVPFIEGCARSLSLAHAAQRSANGEASAPIDWPHAPFAGILARNAVFTSVVLVHGLRRLLPFG
jgi:ADP-ribosyl-[dinitrogen reductase] hydrolase